MLKNGYSNFYALNLATDSLSLSHKYAVAISIGLIGDYGSWGNSFTEND